MTDAAHNPFPDHRMAMDLCGLRMRCRYFTMHPTQLARP